MKTYNRYDIDGQRLDCEMIQSEFGEWMKWEDVVESHLTTARRIYVLELALRQLAETAERCDSWESFPSVALEKAYKALKLMQEN